MREKVFLLISILLNIALVITMIVLLNNKDKELIEISKDYEDCSNRIELYSQDLTDMRNYCDRLSWEIYYHHTSTYDGEIYEYYE